MNESDWPFVCFHHASLSDFMRFWEKLYSGYGEEFYQERIGHPLTEKRIAKWFVWKNGMGLSTKKAETIRRYLSLDEHLSRDTSTETIVRISLISKSATNGKWIGRYGASGGS